MKSQKNEPDPTTASDRPDKGPVPKSEQAIRLDEARLHRAFDYLKSTLQESDPLDANLGSINSGLIRMSLGFERSLLSKLEDGSPDVGQLIQILPAIETHLRMMRQVERFAQLKLRIEQARKRERTDDHTTPGLDAPAGPARSQNEDSAV